MPKHQKPHQPLLAPFTPPLPTIRSERSARVANIFGLTDHLPAHPAPMPPPPWLESILPTPGQIVLITGPSGAGKSTLLGHLQNRLGDRALDVDRLVLPTCPLTDCFPDLSLEDTLRVLSRIGLGEAWSYLRTPAELSEGQRWRLKLAMALNGPEKVLVVDEFAALLDRVTAQIVSRCFRKWISASPASAIVATSHTDLVAALAPDRIVTCDFTRVSIDQCCQKQYTRGEAGLAEFRGEEITNHTNLHE